MKPCKLARELRKELFIVVRTSYVSRGMMAEQAGADDVVVEEIVTARAMRKAVMKGLEEER